MNLESALLKYEPIIGIEIHAQLNTKSKAYCGDGNEFGAIPNTRTSPVSLGHPGTLPKFNKEIINHALKLGLALDCEITRWMHFDRKNYFYADLPKGYQITQDKTPICRKGQILIRLENNETKNIELTRIHMEEDSGKSIHDLDPFNTLIDLNRAGVPLLEIVTEPVIRTSKEAYEYVTEIRKLLRYLEICDGNMEEGSMRCDVNISIMPIGSEKFGDRVEVKNLNSIRNVQRSIDYEIVRQAKVLDGGEKVKVETRTFDAPSGKTSAMRKKEAAHDYRYFPEPDLNPIKIEENHLIDIKSKMPALPNELFKKFTENYGLSNYDALVIIEQKEIAQYFEQLVQFTTNFKTAANWVMVNIKSYLNQQAIEINSFPVSAEKMGLLIQMIDENLISNSLANQKLFPEMIKNPNEHPQSIAEKNDWISSDSEEELLSLVTKIIDENPSESERLKNGEKKLIGFFMGKIMKASNGTADPKKIAQILNKSLSQ
ncbi:MAG: Asp-tRNA(Asn)/Glu-tRNA(Gln) amidotransferase subunit GatB [Flavobacteriales bacterium]|nr:Asp-tRNA(Asn)/Glu-tRNA(Gln) amidotransferase subunit GatB [Flavobacteriales bacterium]MDG1440707.1 Asp-tRNA(Asn)/Glu-tRNA(Gln) amidotransferase subunit GatB [Flavobacteriales bacterium]